MLPLPLRPPCSRRRLAALGATPFRRRRRLQRGFNLVPRDARLNCARYFYIYEIMKASKVIAALGALAQETRLGVFRLLVQRGREGMPAGAIGERLGLPSPTLSFHLNQLRQAGLVNSRRESRSIIYGANYKTMNRLLAYLTENCCGGRPERCAAPEACAPAQAPPAKRERPPQARSAGVNLDA